MLCATSVHMLCALSQNMCANGAFAAFREDLAGKPFVGPAGLMLDRALEQAGADLSGFCRGRRMQIAGLVTLVPAISRKDVSILANSILAPRFLCSTKGATDRA